MTNETFELRKNMKGFEKAIHIHEAMPSVVKRLLESCLTGECFDHVDSTPIPSLESVAMIIQQARRILFPGYFTQTVLAPSNLDYCLRRETTELFENLRQQIILSIQHECLRQAQPCSRCTEFGCETALKFMQTLPRLRVILATDVRAGFGGDPAAKSCDEVIFSYPGLLAITAYRMAHELYKQNVPLLPRMITEHAHSLTGIDIHPGAEIGESFFIDHGTGVVIGETTEIGDRVRIYQGVTLGALSIPTQAVESFRNKKRHPTIEDDVIIYSNATLLGGETVIGARSIIGGNVWITESVPPDTKVVLKQPELVYFGNNPKQPQKSKTAKIAKPFRNIATVVGRS